MHSNLFETSIQLVSQVFRLENLIDQLEFEISLAQRSIAELIGQIEHNEKSITSFPDAKLNTQLRMKINEMRREVFRGQIKIKKNQQKLSKNKFLRQSKLSTLPNLPSTPMIPPNSSINSYFHRFDWDVILKIVN